MERAMFFSKIFGPVRLAAALLIIMSFAACVKKSEEAIVLEKEHIDAAEPRPSASPTGSPANEEPVIQEMAEDEIAVDGIVMKKEVRGTSKDPRAATAEQWRVKVQMVPDGRRFTVQTDRSHFEKAKLGDRVKVSYRQGNYTGTVWSAQIED
jgi:hypothetical protein